MLGFRVSESLDDECQLIIEAGNLAERSRIRGVCCQSKHLCSERVINGYADIVDGGGGVGLIFRVNTDGVGQLDGR